MAKLTSFDDLGALLPHDGDSPEGGAEERTPRTGYDGRAQKLEVMLDSRRRGRVVTLVKGFQARPGELESIVAELKRLCGAGGRALDNAIELQGDHRERVVEKLRGMGYIVRTR